MYDIKRKILPIDFIDELNSLQKLGFIFRGHLSAKWRLQPHAFRKESKIAIAKKYPVPQEVINQWKKGNVLDVMKSWSHGELSNPAMISRALDFVVYLLQYNSYLHQYYSKLPKDLRSYDDEELISRLSKRNLTCEQTFIDFVNFLYPFLLYRVTPEGKVIMKPNPPGEITGFDETWPQHYSFPSAALDWTLSVPIALHFAIREIQNLSSVNIEIAICCYKQINNNHNFVQIIEKSKLKKNQRAERQHGLFTYFTDPCTFYMAHGDFPSVETYCQDELKSSISLIKRTIEINKSNIEFFRSYIKSNNIDDDYLLLDPKYNLNMRSA